eukprot:CAMPEP_0194370076 /NCGR_PEP_ID=MMETSP0174-20130528/18412_1 /TAXON_ID=216777 /ORGANISM="Proboscia alata, Strain PI-D3" /LENGTH=240 /DNA_ID=CAMNT_0039147365 /DNA_START=206 /DNA_END=928 /DNA_ORIENTATION=+
MAAAGDDTLNGLLVSKNLATINLILASQSPRRAEILDMMGLRGQYIAIPSPLDESELQQKFESEEPHEYARILANGKARALGEALLNKDDTIVNTVAELQKNRGIGTYLHTKTLVIGSDTIVDCNGQILEKPTSKNDAVQMLTKLSGRWHKVHTGVSVYSSLNSYKDPVISFTETTDVLFGSLSKKDIDAYVATGEPMDKAGSYGIQGIGGQFVKEIKGDFFTVMGLPMHRLSKELSSIL